MELNIINTGEHPNDQTADHIADACDKVNANFDELFQVVGLKHKKLEWQDLSQTREFFEGVKKRFEFLELIENGKTN